MTPAERQALREKHTEIIFREGVSCCSLCHHEWHGFAVVVPYPCDVIKVLDATEPAIDNKVSVSGLNDNLLSVDCEHVEHGEVPMYKENVWLAFTYCPKCGEKL